MKLLKTERTKIVAEAVMLAVASAYLGSALIYESWLPEWYAFVGILLGGCFVIWLSYQLGPVEKAPADSVKTKGSIRIYESWFMKLISRIPRVTLYWILAVLGFILLALLYEFLSRNPF